MRHIFVFVFAGILAIPSIVEAQLPFDHQPNKNPYRSLFGEREEKSVDTRVPPLAAPLPAELNASARLGGSTVPRTTVVCGLTIVQPDFSVDSRMLIAPPTAGTEHTIRAVTPAICTPEADSERR
jgi:hypothetical protein